MRTTFHVNPFDDDCNEFSTRSYCNSRKSDLQNTFVKLINLMNLSNIKTLIIRITISITKILLIILYTIFNYYHNQNINNNAQFYTLYDINFIIF